MFSQLVPSREGGRPGPELVQPQADPTDHGQPACAPLTRPAQPHLAQPDRNHIAIESRRHAVLGKSAIWVERPAFVERLDRLAPIRALAVVDLAEIENTAAEQRARREPGGSRPPTTSRCSLPSLRRILWRKNMPETRAAPISAQGPWSALQPILGHSAQYNQLLIVLAHPENRKNQRELVKSGYAGYSRFGLFRTRDPFRPAPCSFGTRAFGRNRDRHRVFLRLSGQ
jgi:hypothetical protein